MRTIAILPVKSFGAAKQRLGDLLAGGSRRALAQAMFSDVLSALRHVPELDEVAVVTGDSSAEWAARAERVLVLPDPLEDGQSAAAEIGVRHALAEGFDRALMVPGDAPLLDPAEVSDLLQRDDATASIVPDRHGTGTNALLLSPPDAFVPSFGPGSFERHVAGARDAAVDYSVDELPSLTPGRGHPRRPGRGGPPPREPPRAGPPDPRGPESARTHGSAAHAGRGRRLTDLSVHAVDGLPEVAEGDDLAALLEGAARAGDVLVVAHKIVSKAEGRVRDLAAVEPGERAVELAGEHDKDPRLVQVVLDETATLLRAEHGVLVCETHHGFICANAGVDRSNAPEGHAILLPADPDRSARELRARLPGRPAVVISDSFGRAWRMGQVDVAIGAAGLQPVDDWRGRTDRGGRELGATALAAADAVAAAADLARAKDAGQPAVVIRGLERLVTEEDGPGAASLRRPASEDLFR